MIMVGVLCLVVGVVSGSVSWVLGFRKGLSMGKEVILGKLEKNFGVEIKEGLGPMEVVE